MMNEDDIWKEPVDVEMQGTFEGKPDGEEWSLDWSNSPSLPNSDQGWSERDPDEQMSSSSPRSQTSAGFARDFSDKDEAVAFIVRLLEKNRGRFVLARLSREVKQFPSLRAQIGPIRKFLEVEHGDRFTIVKEEGVWMVHLVSPGEEKSFQKKFALSDLGPLNVSRLNEFLEKFRHRVTPSSEKERLTNVSQNVEWSSDGILDGEQLKQRKERWESKISSSKEYLQMKSFREQLPAFAARDEILRVVSNSQVSIIFGNTGCGKSTQVPQIILDSAICEEQNVSIIVTQPRRISAIALARRVAEERDEKVRESVGYQIRFERVASLDTKLLFMTQGILLRRLESDLELRGVTHVIVDEIHERDCLTDFSLLILRNLIERRKDLKLILMSATIDRQVFLDYFHNQCGVVSIPGKLFPITEFFLEDVVNLTGYIPPSSHQMRNDYYQEKNWGNKAWRAKRTKFATMDTSYNTFVNRYRGRLQESVVRILFDLSLQAEDGDGIHYDLVVRLVEKIANEEEDGAILIFAPGWNSISKIVTLLKKSEYSRKLHVLLVHSMMQTAQQMQIFRSPPAGMRKVVVATNIAETSITIDDVVFVIDCGLINETNYDPVSNLVLLSPVRVSQSNAQQRAGRAGRRQPGKVFRLFSRIDYEDSPVFQVAEMLRTPVEELCLKVKSLDLGRVEEVLGNVVSPPERKAVLHAMDLLVSIGAVSPSTSEDVSLTRLGIMLLDLPVHPLLGKTLVLGAVLGVLDPILSIVACLSFRSPFTMVLGKERECDLVKKRFSQNSNSDHIMLVNVFDEWRSLKHNAPPRVVEDWCWENFISSKFLSMIDSMREQFRKTLEGFRCFSNRDFIYRNRSDEKLVLSALGCGLFPNVCSIMRTPQTRRFQPQVLNNRDGRRVAIHPSSVNAKASDLGNDWAVFFEMVKSNSIFVRDCSTVSSLLLVLFSGAPYDSNGHVIIPDESFVGTSIIRLANTQFRIRASDKLIPSLWKFRDLWNSELTAFLETGILDGHVLDEFASFLKGNCRLERQPVQSRSYPPPAHHENVRDGRSHGYRGRNRRGYR